MLGRFIENVKRDELLVKTMISTIVFYFYKTAFWPLTYLFVSSYIILLFLLFIKFDWHFKFKNFIFTFLPPLVLVLIMLCGFLINHDVNPAVLKDFLLLSVLFSFFYFLYLNQVTLKNSIPITFTVNFILILTTIICCINLLYQSAPNLIPVQIAEKLNISDGTTIANDYNFFTLFILFGLIVLNFKPSLLERSFARLKFVKYFLNLLFSINILFSSSRRGLMALLILTVLSLIFKFFKYLKKEKNHGYKSLFKSSVTFIIIFILTVFFVFKITPKQKITITAYRYATLLGLKNYSAVEKFLWEQDPKVPSGEFLINNSSFNPRLEYWTASSPGTTLTYLDTPYGHGIGLTKTGAPISFSLDYVGPKIIYYAEHTYQIKFKIKFIKGDFNSFYLGWWVDDGGKGYSNTLVLDKKTEKLNDEWYSCIAEYTFIDNHVGLIGFINTVADKSEFIITDFELIDKNYNPGLPKYEFEYKGEKEISIWLDEVNAPWNTTNLINNGDFSHGMAFWKYTANELTIEVKEINNKKCALIRRADGNGGDWSLIYEGRNLEFYPNDEYLLSFKFLPVIPKSIPFNIGYWVDEGDGLKIALNYETIPSDDGWIEVRAKYRFRKAHGNMFFPINSQLSNSSFYITDLQLVNLSRIQYQTKPVPTNTKLITDNIDNIDVGRISRIQFAEELWKSKYSFINKIFGHGFDYYEWYLTKYPSPKGTMDYPHNPFITILLYSGIFGLTAYLWLLYRTTRLYYRHRKEYGYFFVGYLLAFFFSFFSGSSPFDPPIMGFFILLPYFIDYLHNSSILSNENTNNRLK